MKNLRTFQGLLKDSPMVFKVMKNTDLQVKILLQKCYNEILKKLVLEK